MTLLGPLTASIFRGLGRSAGCSVARLAALARSCLTRGDRGGAVVELALLMPFLSLILFGVLDFGTLYLNDMQLTDTVAAATRFASLNSATSFFSNASSAPFNTIQGQLQLAKSPTGTTLIPNNDAHIRITYLLNASTECTHYVALNNTFTPGTLATCDVNGNLVTVLITYTFASLTPLGAIFPGGVFTLPISTTMVVAQ
jgi:Flp pilus assembly protein TadG